MAPVAFPLGVSNADITAIVLVGRYEFSTNGFNHLLHAGFLADSCCIFWGRSGNPPRIVMDYMVGAGHYFSSVRFASIVAGASWWTRYKYTTSRVVPANVGGFFVFAGRVGSSQHVKDFGGMGVVTGQSHLNWVEKWVR